MLETYYQNGLITLYHGDVREVLRELPDGIVQTCVTSPPYWGLRDYGVEGQLGSEKTPQEFIANMTAVFEGVKRVLRKDATLWLNMGDSYNGSCGTGGATQKQSLNACSFHGGSTKHAPGLKPKDLCLIPARLAIALQDAGWWVRSDIIWSKPNPMPESCTDRPTKAHEYLWLMAKAGSYFYDAEAVKEDMSAQSIARYAYAFKGTQGAVVCPGDPVGQRTRPDGMREATDGRNKRTVWTIATQPFSEAHFATFPEKLPETCILAGTSEKGACAECGSPWERVTEKTGGSWEDRKANGHPMRYGTNAVDIQASPHLGASTSKTLGWQPTCKCAREETKPCIVLDPFNGAGTTGLVALKLGRRYIGIDLNKDYLDMTIRRIEKYLANPASETGEVAIAPTAKQGVLL